MKNELSTNVEYQLAYLLNFKAKPLDFGLEYLGHFLKPNNYNMVDWLRLVKKVEAKINV